MQQNCKTDEEKIEDDGMNTSKENDFSLETPQDEMTDNAAQDDPSQNPVLNKYWNQRYRLFYRFDEGIKLDDGKI